MDGKYDGSPRFKSDQMSKCKYEQAPTASKLPFKLSIYRLQASDVKACRSKSVMRDANILPSLKPHKLIN